MAEAHTVTARRACLAASCGVTISKHGNRASTSRAGAADVFAALGIPFYAEPAQIVNSIQQTRFAFLFAPYFHPALSQVKPLRQAMGIPALFNLLGPLLNPCQPTIPMIGVAQPHHLDTFAEVLIRLDIAKAAVFHCCGLDEICTVGPIDIIYIHQGKAQRCVLEPLDFGFAYCAVDELMGTDAAGNAEHIRQALSGHDNALADSMILNAGVANYLFSISATPAAGIALAKKVHRLGLGFELLTQLSHQSVPPSARENSSHA